MKLVTGDMWTRLGHADIIFVTTNAALNSKTQLVMGRGAASQAAQRFSSLPALLAKQLIARGRVGGMYGVLPGDQFGYPPTRISAFQVKYHWQDDADMGLIRVGCGYLLMLAGFFDEIVLNFPGIGNGRLAEEEVLPLISRLPDNVFVYKKG